MIKIAQIGLGNWGKNHARILSELDVLHTICDTDEYHAREAGDKFGTTWYDNLAELLTYEDFDAAVVTTPTNTHAEIVSKLLKEDKHVFVEKPMAYSYRDCLHLIKLAKENNVLLTCGYIERFNPAVTQVKNYLDHIKIGELLSLNFRRETNIPPHIKDVGIIYDTAVHDIDTANYLFGEMPQSVYASAGQIQHNHEDYATIMLLYRDNRSAVISANWMSPKKVREFTVTCTKGTIKSDFLTQKINIFTSNETPLHVPVESQEPLFVELNHFVDCIQNKKQPLVTAEQAANVTMIAESALTSSRLNLPTYLEFRASKKLPIVHYETKHI